MRREAHFVKSLWFKGAWGGRYDIRDVEVGVFGGPGCLDYCRAWVTSAEVSTPQNQEYPRSHLSSRLIYSKIIAAHEGNILLTLRAPQCLSGCVVLYTMS
jgi:hypothetical protein